MKRFGYLTALAILVGLALVWLPAAAAAQSSCKATIMMDEIKEGRDDNWTIWLSVETVACAASTGEFDYTLTVRRSSGSLEEVDEKGSWVSERSRGSVPLEYRLAGGGKVLDAKEFRNVRCDCTND